MADLDNAHAGVESDNHYGFLLPEELILLRDRIRRFMREEVKPIEDKLPHDATGCSAKDRAHLRALAEEMGLTRLTVPAKYGGNLKGEVTNGSRRDVRWSNPLSGYLTALHQWPSWKLSMRLGAVAACMARPHRWLRM